MFTPMFAIARTVGWISHWMEMISDPSKKIGRPRQLYIGAAKRDDAGHQRPLIAHTQPANRRSFADRLFICRRAGRIQ